MIQLECQVFVYNEEQDKLIDAGIEIEDDITKADLVKFTFYNIDAIKPYDHRFCTIYTSGDMFIVNQSYETMEKRIQQQMTFRFN
jgi:hypothetical protein